MTALVYQSNLWKLLEKVNFSVRLTLVPFRIGMVQKALKGTWKFWESATCSRDCSPRMAMAVQWNEFFIFSLRSFATFKTAFVSSVQRHLVGRVKLRRLNWKLSRRRMDIQAYYLCLQSMQIGLP